MKKKTQILVTLSSFKIFISIYFFQTICAKDCYGFLEFVHIQDHQSLLVNQQYEYQLFGVAGGVLNRTGDLEFVVVEPCGECLGCV